MADSLEATTDSSLPVLELLSEYQVSPEQRQVIIDASTKSPEYQERLINQFTRNR